MTSNTFMPEITSPLLAAFRRHLYSDGNLRPRRTAQMTIRLAKQFYLRASKEGVTLTRLTDAKIEQLAQGLTPPDAAIAAAHELIHFALDNPQIRPSPAPKPARPRVTPAPPTPAPPITWKVGENFSELKDNAIRAVKEITGLTTFHIATKMTLKEVEAIAADQATDPEHVAAINRYLDERRKMPPPPNAPAFVDRKGNPLNNSHLYRLGKRIK